MIEVQQFKKAYGKTLAVTGLTFKVEPSQVWGLVGHNGAGKTTTMRAIAGLLAPSSGSLHVNGHEVSIDKIAAKRDLAYLSDDPQLFESLTVGEHLKFFASAYQLTDFEDRAKSLLEYFELSQKIDTAAEDLSRGMRQKLAICCGYLHQPAAILFDEPFTGLDPLAIRRLKESIRRRAEDGAAIIVSSHLLAMVEDLCTHFLMLTQGRPTFCGTHEELFQQHGDDANLEEVFFRATALVEEVADAGIKSEETALSGRKLMFRNPLLNVNAPLRKLLWLQARGKIRRTIKKMSSPRRALPTALVFVLMSLYMVKVYIAVAHYQVSIGFSDFRPSSGGNALHPAA